MKLERRGGGEGGSSLIRKLTVTKINLSVSRFNTGHLFGEDQARGRAVAYFLGILGSRLRVSRRPSLRACHL